MLTLFTTIFGGALSMLKNLFSNPKILLAIVAIVAALVIGFEIKHEFNLDQQKITALQSQVTTLTSQNTQLKADVANAVAVNQNNQAVIGQLSAAKINAEKRVAEMQQQQANSSKKISNLQNMIANSKAADDGPVSNVLKQTIQAIQGGQ